jgi:hypothetical protein
MSQKNRRIVRQEAKREEPAEELEGDLEAAPAGDEPTSEELESPAEPEIRTRKVAAAEAAAGGKKKVDPVKVKPTDAFVRDAKGAVRKDADGDDMILAAGYHKGFGFVNENGVRFPPGFKFPGGHVGTRGNVVLNRCPKCGNHNSIDEALLGVCANSKCGYSVLEELEEHDQA